MPPQIHVTIPTSDEPCKKNDQSAASGGFANKGITTRSLLLALILTIPNTFWITVVEVRWYTLDGTSLPLFITPIFFLFWLVLLNLAITRFLPRLAPKLTLTQAELLTIYIFLVIGTLLAGHDMFQNLFGAIAHADRFATPENHWKDLFFALLPKFWLVRDPNAIKGYYQGSVSAYDSQFWKPFIAPLFWWTLFIGTLIGICQCLNILIRTQWSDNERLAFPIVQLPMAMTESLNDGAGTQGMKLFSSRVMWIGFGIAAVVDIINGLHTLYPSTPYLEMVKLYDIGQFLTVRPWSAVAGTNISMYPFAIGLAFFVPLDLSFSCWFFFVARKLFQVFGAAAGLDGPGSAGFPFFEQQASGAWIAWGLTIVWALRGQFRRTWDIAFKKNVVMPAKDSSLTNQYRAAFIGLGLGVCSLAWFSGRIGLTPWIALSFFGLYFLIAITITRVRAELGTPHEIYFVNPRLILVTLFGSQAIGAQALTALSVMYWFNRGYRCHPMPNQLEAMKMGESAKIKSSSILWLLIIAFAWGTLAAYWANMHVTFAEGATAKAAGFKRWVGAESFERLQGWLQTPAKVNLIQSLYVAAGFLMVLFLRGMRSNFLWWPFHPAGYALAVSYAMDYFWFCFFIAWILKAVIIRFGGMKMYNAAIPFFLGLILGDYVVGSLWALYGPLQHLQTYKIYI